MRAQLASIPAKPGQENEDFAAVTTNAAVVIDGAGTPAGSTSGCRHGVAWYSRMLGSALTHQLADQHQPISTCLAAAISNVTRLHRDTCDLDHPGTPSATVTAIREQGGTFEYIVLADSPLVLDLATGPMVICDDREARIGARYRSAMDAAPNGTAAHTTALREYVETMRNHRNRVGGFWVASTDPTAAEHAVTGSLAISDVRAAALLSDGASRPVDRFQLIDWQTLLQLIDRHGPEHLLRLVREAETSDPDGKRWPRGKATDDATAVYSEPSLPGNASS
ncbi:protein phosphatase 2C domain-containing protein [Jiangella asiatica]|uniref:Integrase n=1 Tax=Jiangella asiatica TaxID=2530372 RepID=A0A4V2Z3I2_9ACTN|nr:protein phosphatase 2C domain-containing protein [Jiangella asiatica]TDE12628.1 integrase [Jiangella asiatica]